jgi:hypothetical protein
VYVRCVDGLHSALPKRIVDRARDEIVRDIVEDLVFVPLLHDTRRDLARPEAGDARAPRVALCDAVDFSVHSFGWNLDSQVLACVVDVDELGFHPPPRLRRTIGGA